MGSIKLGLLQVLCWRFARTSRHGLAGTCLKEVNIEDILG